MRTTLAGLPESYESRSEIATKKLKTGRGKLASCTGFLERNKRTWVETALTELTGNIKGSGIWHKVNLM
ncbi:MAG TPA: hypothetical protein DCS30_01990 [Rhizobiales bacterium]|nr:hypothetical protein [Hyphomicrobiales bacterium]